MSFQPWGNPDPQSVAGLNSAMVYGENLQFTAGLNHQVALGSNLQLCVNPSALFELLNVPGRSTLSSFFGSGLGGNMQFTIGSSTNINWGRQFQNQPRNLALRSPGSDIFGSQSRLTAFKSNRSERSSRLSGYRYSASQDGCRHHN